MTPAEVRQEFGVGEKIGDLARQEIVERIGNDFVYHKPSGDEGRRYDIIRAQAKDLAEIMVLLAPGSCRELSTALTRLEEDVMHINAAIARHQRAQ